MAVIFIKITVIRCHYSLFLQLLQPDKKNSLFRKIFLAFFSHICYDVGASLGRQTKISTARRCSKWQSAISAARAWLSVSTSLTPTDVPTDLWSPTSSALRLLLTVLLAMCMFVPDASVPTRSSVQSDLENRFSCTTVYQHTNDSFGFPELFLFFPKNSTSCEHASTHRTYFSYNHEMQIITSSGRWI